MSGATVFSSETVLFDPAIGRREKALLGFEERFSAIEGRLRLLVNLDKLEAWSKRQHKAKLPICDLISEQYPLLIFHGDVGTGKTAMAECAANRMAKESRDEAVLFKLSNQVRGSGKVGEMGALLSAAFERVVASAGKRGRAFLIIDEGDSIGAARTQEHSHHEDKVAVNTLIQAIDDLRALNGRVVVFLCTNRLAALDPALLRRAAVVEEFARPDNQARLDLLRMDLEGLRLTEPQLRKLVALTGARNGQPAWSYSDIRTRLYPAAMARAFDSRALSFEDLETVAETLMPSPAMEGY